MTLIRTLVTTLIITSVGTAYAGEHKAGDNNANQSCFYDSNPGKNKWHYYFCGEQGNKCAGKKYGGNKATTWLTGNNDSKLVLKDLEFFTFLTDPKDTFCCCGGSDNTAGTFVKAIHATDCYTDDKPAETIKELGNDQQCKELTYKTVCGTTKKITCTNPEEVCPNGYKWRNGTCAQICSGDQVYESKNLNNCVSCESTNYQGIVRNDKEAYCLTCDKDTEFFNKTTKKCINKANLKQYSHPEMKECWRCPNNYLKECLQAINLADKMGKAGQDRIKEINAQGSFLNINDLAKQCHLDE